MVCKTPSAGSNFGEEARGRKDDSLPRNLPIIILIKNIYEEKTDDFAATPALEGSGTTDSLFRKAETRTKRKRPTETGRSGKSSAAGARKPQAP